MDFDGRMVKPQRRRGLLRIVQDPSGMKSLQWCDADTKNPIDNVYVFPGDCKFEKVKQTTDRVYLLQFMQSDRKMFYWFQDEEKDKDADHCKKIHNILNGIEEPPAANAAPATAAH